VSDAVQSGLPQFDAVAYTLATRGLVLPLLRQLSVEEKQRRRVKWGLRRFSTRKPFTGWFVAADVHGSADLKADDFEWRELLPDHSAPLAGGTLKAAAKERIAAAAADARQAEEVRLTAAQAETERRGKEFAQQAQALMLAHCRSLLKLAGIKRSKKRALKRVQKFVETMAARAQAGDALAVLLAMRWLEVKEKGLAPGVEISAEAENDFHQYFDHVYSAVTRRRS
jgi:hypothetical protein